MFTPGLTVTHSVMPLRTRITNVPCMLRSSADCGTIKEDCGRRTGHETDGNIPGASNESAFLTSSSTGIVRVFVSKESETRATVPMKVLLGNAGTEKFTLAPGITPAV